MNTRWTERYKAKCSKDKLVESLGFVAVLTFIGGYLDAYTYITRGGVFANNQTGNVAKLGIELFNRNWSGALGSLYPLLATVAGAFFAEHVMSGRFPRRPDQWRQVILMTELVLLAIVGLMPLTVPNWAVNLAISFIAAWQLSGFRKFEGWVHNTTISTGNLRAVGQYSYQALFLARGPATAAKTVKYILVVSSFAVGALVGAAFCRILYERAVWICCPLLLLLMACYGLAPSER